MLGFFLVAMSARVGSAHPLHTTLTEIVYDAGSRSLSVSLRVFVDDFGAGVAQATGTERKSDGMVQDAAIIQYILRRFAVSGADGRPLAMRWFGVRRAGDAMFIRMRIPIGRSPVGLRLRNDLLFERFRDQVNIVRASRGTVMQTLLFTAGDGVKPLL